jgi:dTMP kinase
LAGGEVVVVDRFSGSTLAYQGFGRGLPLSEVRAACAVATGGRWPDLNVLLDVPIETGARRREGRPDRFEREAVEFHERVRQGFLALAHEEPDRWCVIDGADDASAVAERVAAAVSERLGLP